MSVTFKPHHAYIFINFVSVNCPPGSQGVTGSTCEQCTIDTFQDQQGQATCKPCPSGQSNLFTGAVECTGENNCTSITSITSTYIATEL